MKFMWIVEMTLDKEDGVWSRKHYVATDFADALARALKYLSEEKGEAAEDGGLLLDITSIERGVKIDE